MNKFKIVEIELDTNTTHVIEGMEIVGSHLRDVGLRTFIVLVVKQ